MGCFSGPEINEDGLVVALDAGNTKSFNNTSPDEYFSNVSLLLNGNGSNGSTTITDSSTHNHSITVSGNAQISTAQSKFGGSSMLFDGDGDYVRATDSSEFAFGTGDFTVEAWVRGTGSFYETRTSISQAPGFEFAVSSNTIKIWDGQGQSYVYNGSTTYNWTDWHHVAVSRSSTTLRVFVDGSLDGTATTSRNLTHQGAIIGANINRVINGSGGSSFNGYIDDVRITKGVARYTSNFTPPTSQHPAGPVWTDIVGGNTGTLTGEPTFSSGNDGYLDFDGTDDFVTLGTQINSDITTTNVTISFWAYIDSTANDEIFVSMETLGINIPLIIWYDTISTYEVQNTGSGDVGGGSINVITTAVTDASSEKRFTTSNNALIANTWYNIVVVLDVTNNEFYTYINGVEEAKWVSNNTSGGIKSTTNNFRIGGGSPYLDGRISNFSVYNRALTASEVLQHYNALKRRYAPSELYAFTSAYFTVSQALTDATTSQEHRFGPTQTEVRAWLSGTSNGGGGHSWANTYVDCPQDGYQRWTIPKSGKYRITAKGGGAGKTQQNHIGRGVKLTADFNLIKGEQLILAVGQGVPDDSGSDSCNGGGGASWVMSGSNYTTAIPLIVAAGAGGDTSDGQGPKDQPSTTLGSSITVTPTIGEGGGSAVTGKETTPINSSASAGRGSQNTTYPNSAGWLSDGLDVPGQTSGIGGHCFRTDLIGGTRSDSTAGYGGFGGGSGGQDEEGNASGGFTGAFGTDSGTIAGNGSSFVNDDTSGNVSVVLGQATTTFQNTDYTSEDQYQGWIKIEFIS